MQASLAWIIFWKNFIGVYLIICMLSSEYALRLAQESISKFLDAIMLYANIEWRLLQIINWIIFLLMSHEIIGLIEAAIKCS